MMIDHRDQIQKANGMASDSPYKKLQAAHDQILLDYYDRQDKAAAARQRAQEDADLEEEAAENYTISFSYNVKGGSK
jgi:hypothetical protein